ncbi:endonuclease domain-containing protein [Candidatus Falkowbacteria bacterium]|nr:endonuclease domain-containing protein [Candidatus Falkowbacteria bacterium]
MGRFNKRKFKHLRQKLRRESTKSEDLLWYELNQRQLGFKFRRQQGIGDYIVDFYCPELRLVIEVDGISHDDSDVRQRDIVRQRYLEDLGSRVVRYTTDEVFKNMEEWS